MAAFLVWFIVLGSLRSLSETLQVLPHRHHYRAPRARSILIPCAGHPRLRISLAVKLSASSNSSMPLAALLMLAPCLTGAADGIFQRRATVSLQLTSQSAPASSSVLTMPM